MYQVLPAIFGTSIGSNGGAAVGVIIVNNPAVQNIGIDELGKHMLCVSSI